MSAAGGLDGDLALAIGADLGGGGGGSLIFFFFLLTDAVQHVHQLNDGEQHHRNDEEIEDGHDEGTVLEGDVVDGKGQIAEITAENDADERGDDVGNQGIHDGLKGGADHDTDSHIHNVPSVNKISEFANDLFQWKQLLRDFLSL